MPRRYTFNGGVHPPHSKSRTERLPIEVFPAPKKVIIPLSQHIGAPAKPVVKRGDRVLVGQVLGEPGGFVSSPVHSSVSGSVLSIGPYAHPMGRQIVSIEIENDEKNETIAFTASIKAWRDAAPQELVQQIQAAGVVGMGGAGFPTHVKLSPPSNKPIDILIINGAECEPFLTADHLLMLERTGDFIEGVLILKKILNAKKCFIGIEENKPDAVKKITSLLNDARLREIRLCTLIAKYPQGGEKQLIRAITGREVPSGGLPMDIGCVVQNVGTTVAVFDAVNRGIPLYERVVTVTGPAVGSPKNLLVRIGTPINFLLEACSFNQKSVRKIIMGGPMMGLALSDVNVPVIKTTSGLLAVDTTTPALRTYPCINCGHCIRACPINLVPSRIAKYIEKENYQAAEEWNVMDCMECGSCAYICPAKINLVHWMKLGKYHVQASRAAAAARK
ncbi:MAG: electron transport complex subunit RsxC [Chitinispirillaceae bacterium]|nr:electron transport complex subunit RsxC [Chitinispirillaceae bacterium]